MRIEGSRYFVLFLFSARIFETQFPIKSDIVERWRYTRRFHDAVLEVRSRRSLRVESFDGSITESIIIAVAVPYRI